MTSEVIYFADGGTIGRNPSPRGIYWSVAVEEAGGPSRVVVSRERSGEYRTNNDAEWLALLAALYHARAYYRTRRITIRSDSRLIVRQFNRTWRTKIARHHRWRTEAHLVAEELVSCSVEWTSRIFMVDRLGH